MKSGNNYKIIFEKDWQCVSCALCAIVNNPRPIRHLCIHTWHASSTLCQRTSVGTGPGFTILNISTNFHLYCPPPFSFFLPPARLQDDEHGILSRCLAKGGCRRYALVELRRMRMLYISIMQSPRVQLHPPHLMVKVKGEV